MPSAWILSAQPASLTTATRDSLTSWVKAPAVVIEPPAAAKRVKSASVIASLPGPGSRSKSGRWVRSKPRVRDSSS